MVLEDEDIKATVTLAKAKGPGGVRRVTLISCFCWAGKPVDWNFS